MDQTSLGTFSGYKVLWHYVRCLPQVLVNVSELEIMLWIFFLMRQVFLNLHSTRKQLNSCFPLTSVHGVGQHWCSLPRGKPSYEFNSEVSSKIMSTGAHKCHSWTKTGKKGGKKRKSRKNMKFKKINKNTKQRASIQKGVRFWGAAKCHSSSVSTKSIHLRLSHVMVFRCTRKSPYCQHRGWIANSLQRPS